MFESAKSFFETFSHDYLAKEKDKYLFYVVCTRAQHSLTVYNQKKLVLERKK